MREKPIYIIRTDCFSEDGIDRRNVVLPFYYTKIEDAKHTFNALVAKYKRDNNDLFDEKEHDDYDIEETETSFSVVSNDDSWYEYYISIDKLYAGVAGEDALKCQVV